MGAEVDPVGALAEESVAGEAVASERAGRIHKRKGSVTLLPIVTMPEDDITHPIPDLTGYITEGQIVLDRELDRVDVYPPVKVLPSLSRLMKDSTGEGYTHVDHPALANQLYAAYARAVHMRVLASVVGREGLAETDRQFLDFGDRFEHELVRQGRARTLDETMELGWRLLRGLDRNPLPQRTLAWFADRVLVAGHVLAERRLRKRPLDVAACALCVLDHYRDGLVEIPEALVDQVRSHIVEVAA